MWYGIMHDAILYSITAVAQKVLVIVANNNGMYGMKHDVYNLLVI